MKGLIKLMEIQLMKADGPSSSPVSSKISATEGKCFPAQARNASKITSWMALWHYLRDRGEDMRKCTLMPSSHEGTESIHICGVSGGSQELTALEAKIRLTGTDWQKHPIVTGPGAPCILGIDYLRRGHFKDPKVCFAWPVRRSVCCGVAASKRAAGTNCHKSSAQTAVPNQQGFLAPHSEVDSSIRESRSDQQNSLTF